MNLVFWILIFAIAVLIWVVTRPLWKPFGEWLYYRIEEIDETLKDEHEIVLDVKGEDDDERSGSDKEEN